jgi:hypothetical protein
MLGKFKLCPLPDSSVKQTDNLLFFGKKLNLVLSAEGAA